jgi:HrpA-like RNA helicase
MSKFPLDPQYSKAVITSALFEVSTSMINLVSMLSTESIWKKVLRINEE